MTAATGASASCGAASSRCAWTAAVSRLRCPGSLPTVARPTPFMTRCEAQVFRQAWLRGRAVRRPRPPRASPRRAAPARGARAMAAPRARGSVAACLPATGAGRVGRGLVFVPATCALAPALPGSPISSDLLPGSRAVWHARTLGRVFFDPPRSGHGAVEVRRTTAYPARC